MGNCTSLTRKKRKGESATDNNSNVNIKQPVEDVMYASIDHSTSHGSRRTRETTVDDCDYATVYIPPALQVQPEPDRLSKECDDDYVLMS